MSAGNESPGIKIALAILAAAGAIAAAAFPFLSEKYKTDRAISATQTADALSITRTAVALSLAPTATLAPTLAPTRPPAPAEPAAPPPTAPEAAPTDTPTDAPTETPTAEPYFTIVNRLARPAIILVDDRRLGEAPPYGERDFTPAGFPVTAHFRVRRPLDADGKPLGVEVSGYWTDPANPGDRRVLDNLVGDSEYYYLILSNQTDQACRVTVNRGLDDEAQLPLPLPPGAAEVEYGYYELRPYSTVYLTCGSDEWYWGRKNATDDARPLGEQLEEASGDLRLILAP